jgi:hypothetical protein
MAGLGPDGLVEGRNCGSCSLCCKVLHIGWLTPSKPANRWCTHCKPGQGCSIWNATIPQECLNYFCQWRRMPQLGDAWRPDRTGFLINRQNETLPFEVVVDPGRPDSWRREPYYSQLKRAAHSAIEQKSAFVVQVGSRQWILLPDGEVPVPNGLENTDFRIEPASGQASGYRVVFLKSVQ